MFRFLLELRVWWRYATASEDYQRSVPKIKCPINMYKCLGSSVNPEKISLTIKGLGVTLVPIIVAIAQWYGVELAQEELIEFVNAIVSVVAAVMVVYGLARKLWYKFF